MFEHFNGTLGHDLHLLISWWAVLGFFGASFLPPVNGDKRIALKQAFILGPFFWIGVPLYGLYLLSRKNSYDSTE